MSEEKLPQKYLAYLQKGPGEPLMIQDRSYQHPPPSEVAIRIVCCGVCHTDLHMAEGVLGLTKNWPAIPGHEFIGDVVEVGSEVSRWKVGDRVGGAWHGGHDNECDPCQQGFFQSCNNQVINGVSRPGGFSEYCTVRQEAIVKIPANLDPVQTAPFLCAGVTVFNSLRHLQLKPGDTVAIQGLGGLGHLALQYARKMGFRVVAISSSSAKRDYAFELGAHHFIDTSTQNVTDELLELGGAKLIMLTAPNPTGMGQYMNGLCFQGKLLLLTHKRLLISPAIGDVLVDSSVLIQKSCSVQGWCTGHARDCEEAVEFANLHGIRCEVETFQFGQLEEAFDRLKSGGLRFRAVLTMQN
ncbi:unnamed protein product [Fusarium fujikuroi]|uniref:Enoyl reductase (ER) domain-containing protein n=1 Tax=Fusarium fujikuroi TaxID=5127 RepID=A0A9Q9RXF6_FUSFU|nr:unnamed protein product [Fusarium fujikuroi]VZI11114.1 unnamed protein product [Fusarium fujikuroi]